MAEPRGPFRPKVKLDRSQVRDQRLNTPVETRAGWDGRQRIGQPPYLFPIPPLRRINPSVPRQRKPRVRGGSFTPGPFNPNARIGPNTSVVRDPGIKANAVPRPGDLRSAAVSLARGQVPQGSLLGNIVGTLGRALSGGRAGVPRNVSPVSPPALQSITPNMVNQSEVGSVLRGVIRRRLGTRTMTTAQRPRSRAGSARTM